MSLGKRTARHDTARVQKVAVDSSIWWEYKPQQRVMTVDGVAGVVTAVLDGPHPGNESYEVRLDNGMGGGQYTASQLSRASTTTASHEHEATGLHLAHEDYPELGTILYDRPPIERVEHLASRPFVRDSVKDDTVYLRFGDWDKKTERSHNNVTGHTEDGVSVYDLDHHGHPKDPDPDFSRGHEHDESCDDDCDMDASNHEYGNDTHEEMQGRVHRAERGRHFGQDRPSERAHLVRGEMVGIGHDGEPLLNKVKRVGDWIDHKHLFFPGAPKHPLARGAYDEGYEHPKGLPKQAAAEGLDEDQHRALNRLKGLPDRIGPSDAHKLFSEHNIVLHDSSPHQHGFHAEPDFDTEYHAPDDELHTGQAHLYRPALEHYIKHPYEHSDDLLDTENGEDKRAQTYTHQDKTWIAEGHHRILADRMTHGNGVDAAHDDMDGRSPDGYADHVEYGHHTGAIEAPTGEPMDQGLPPCSYCGNPALAISGDNGRNVQATCGTCQGTMSSWGGQFTPELIGDPSNHPSQQPDKDSGGVGGVGDLYGPKPVRQMNDADHSASLHTAGDNFRLMHGAPDEHSGKPWHKVMGDDPDEHVRIYRAAPHGVDKFHSGDWVTTNPDYAHLHSHQYDGSPDWPVMSHEVPAKHLHTDENDANEWGYNGPTIHGPEYHHPEHGLISNEDHHEEHEKNERRRAREQEEDEPEPVKPMRGTRYRGGAINLSPGDHAFVHSTAPRSQRAKHLHGLISEEHVGQDQDPDREDASYSAGARAKFHPKGTNPTQFMLHEKGKTGEVRGISFGQGRDWLDHESGFEHHTFPTAKKKGSLSFLSGLDSETLFQFTAAWSDVRAKAKRLRAEGSVRITVASSDGIGGEVKGDNNVYETVLSYAPGSQKVAYWTCGCKWSAYAWGRSPAYRRFEGRMCSHALAMQFEAQARGMFGKTVQPDDTRPTWLRQRTPVVVQHERDTGRDLTRRAVPPANMRRVFEGALVDETPPIVHLARFALSEGEEPVSLMRKLLALGYSHDQAKVVFRQASLAGPEHETKCPDCGSPISSRRNKCPRCGADLSGHEPTDLHEATLHIAAHVPCGECEGVGTIEHEVEPTDEEAENPHHVPGKWHETCDVCDGSGRVDLESIEEPEEDHHQKKVREHMEGRVNGAPHGVGCPPFCPIQQQMPLEHRQRVRDEWRAKHGMLVESAREDECGACEGRGHFSTPESHVECEFCDGTGRYDPASDHSVDRGTVSRHLWDRRERTATPHGVDCPAFCPVQKQMSLNEGSATKHGKKSDTGPTHAGVVLKARDTGRILMLQRNLEDTEDKAAGTWEFPGGGIEDEDTTALHAGIREWEEEVGQKFPSGGAVHHVWSSPNGVYHGHVVVIPEERQVALHDGRVTTNPDDPDGKTAEQAAWWEPEHARKNPALRPECRTSPWKEIGKAGANAKTAAAWDLLEELDQEHPAPLHSNSENPGSTGFATSQDPPEFDHPTVNTTLYGGAWGSLHEQPEPALPSTDGADDDFDDPAMWAIDQHPATHDEISPLSGTLSPQQFTGSVEDIVARFQATAGARAINAGTPSRGPSEGDIAGAARAYLEKTALKEFNFQEQQELITEGARDNVMARNADRLDIADTHYSAIEAALAAEEALANPDDIFA